ncbi:hypothetical protein CC86DRAFT_207459 [Ophiobolus disseminans]|uniref:Uncharacterized protein n=1 Tax=Ophiobolus disseminans TaxID=1469910 RepID=A0A6A7A4Q6_9PLEO|nr:hypothetical protein CC86DRAFT_207459 [Ophiobolus disseminans]
MLWYDRAALTSVLARNASHPSSTLTTFFCMLQVSNKIAKEMFSPAREAYYTQSTQEPEWKTVLGYIARRFDGGPWSFPPTSNNTHPYNLKYEPPNEDYERLFFR